MTARAAAFAWREIRAGTGSLKLLAVCIFLGVLTLSAVGSLGEAVRHSIDANGRTILGGDVAATFTQRLPNPQEMHALQGLGGRMSRSFRLRAMLETTGDTPETLPPETLLVELKAVDRLWPLYGQAHLLQSGTARHGLPQHGVAPSRALANRLALKEGDTVVLGRLRTRVAAIVERAPDEAGDGIGFGPALYIPLETLGETGLIEEGSLYHHKIRIALPDSLAAADARHALEQTLPNAGWRLADSRDAAPGLSRFIRQLVQYLTLAGLSALAIAGIGAGNGVRSYLAGHATTIATMKMLGATPAFIARVYFLIVGTVALAAAVAGALAGSMVPVAGSQFLDGLLPVAIGGNRFFPMSVLVAMIHGLLIAFAFSCPPLSSASRLSPTRVFQRTTGTRQRPAWPALAASALALIAVVLLATLESGLPAITLGFFGGLLVVILLLWATGWLLAHGAGRLRHLRSLPVVMAIRSLSGARNHTSEIMMALGLALAIFAGLSLTETSFRRALLSHIPDQAPSLIVLDLPKDSREPFLSLLPANAEVELVPNLRGPVTAINDRPVAGMGKIPDDLWVLQGDRSVTFASLPPAHNPLVAGQWWPKDYDGPPLVSMDREQAARLGLSTGDSITLSIMGVEIRARIASLRAVDWDSLRFNFVLIYSPNTLESAPFSWMVSVRLPEGQAAPLVREITTAFPSASTLEVSGIVSEIHHVSRQILMAIRAASVTTILAGIAVLLGAIATETHARRRNMVTLKMLGATTWQLRRAIFLEFLLLGSAAAIVALAIGAAISHVLVSRIFELPWNPDWAAATLTVGFGAALVATIGTLGNRRALRASVRDALRET